MVTPCRFLSCFRQFKHAAKFNQPLAAWNTASVTNMIGLFDGARAFNMPIGQWNVASVANMLGM